MSNKFLIAAGIMNESDPASIIVWGAGGSLIVNEQAEERQEDLTCSHVTRPSDGIASWMLALLIIAAFMYAFSMDEVADRAYGHALGATQDGAEY